MKPVRFHPSIQGDLDAAMDHYSLVSNRLPDEFWEEVFGCIDQIQENLKRYPVQPNGLRRCNLKLSGQARVGVFSDQKRLPANGDGVKATESA